MTDAADEPRCDHCERRADVEATTTWRALSQLGVEMMTRVREQLPAPIVSRICVLCACRVVAGLPLEQD